MGLKTKICIGLLSFYSTKLWDIGNYEKHNYKELGFKKHPNWYD